MTPIAESELILDKRGAIYHLGLLPEEMAETILLVGCLLYTSRCV